MSSGGAQVSGRTDDADAGAVDHAVVHYGAEVRGAQLAEVSLDDQQRFPDQRRRVLHFLDPRCGGRAEPDHRGAPWPRVGARARSAG